MAMLGMMGLSILSGAAFAEWRRMVLRLPGLGRFAPLGLAALVLMILYAQYASGSLTPRAFGWTPLPSEYPLAEAVSPNSPILAAVASSPPGPLLEIPATTGPQPWPDITMNATAMYRAIFHQRPILNGYTGFWPPGFRARMARTTELPAPEALAALRSETGLALILVHTAAYGRDAQIVCAMRKGTPAERLDCRENLGARLRQPWLDIADDGTRVDLRLVMRHDDDLLFAVLEAPAATSSDAAGHSDG
jgi:hypothetical protein